MSIPENHILALCDFETTGVDPKADQPVEVALLFVDHKLRILHAYESVFDDVPSSIDEVMGEEQASMIHKITLEERSCGRSRVVIAEDILTICERLHRKRIVLCSDNIQFEWQFMKKVLQGYVWPFHYCGWDTSLLLEATGVGDPRDVPHRAMPDVGRLYEALHRAIGLADRNARTRNP